MTSAKERDRIIDYLKRSYTRARNNGDYELCDMIARAITAMNTTVKRDP